MNNWKGLLCKYFYFFHFDKKIRKIYDTKWLLLIKKQMKIIFFLNKKTNEFFFFVFKLVEYAMPRTRVCFWQFLSFNVLTVFDGILWKRWLFFLTFAFLFYFILILIFCCQKQVLPQVILYSSIVLCCVYQIVSVRIFFPSHMHTIQYPYLISTLLFDTMNLLRITL